MSNIDWVVLVATLVLMISYGLYKGRKQTGAESYLLADRQMPWYIVLLGVMATQASAITFLSAPGQAYTDGMRFLQYYFGLPIAMVVISATFIPIFRKLNVYTAYEYLEQRFDRKTRLLTSCLFLLSRGLSTGISIYAPAIIIASMLHMNVYLANVLTGGLLLIYTYAGGAAAVAHTQKLQFLIILSAMAFAGYLVVHNLPGGLTFTDALYVAGKTGKLNVITTDFNWKDKYNVWSGLIGGFFLALSYFGTDQSQVGRYITAKDNKQGREGLLLNGMVKIPMQFLILLMGALLFTFYSLKPAPVNFNDVAMAKMAHSGSAELNKANSAYQTLHEQYRQQCIQVANMHHQGLSAPAETLSEMKKNADSLKTIRKKVSGMLLASGYSSDKDDTNYIFLHFVRHALPVGAIGLLFAVIILASWGSISAALNSLAASSLMDIHLVSKEQITGAKQLRLGRLHTLLWGVFCICFAMFAAQLGSLIEAVNVLGSLFYGTILGIFMVAFYQKKTSGNAVFIAAIFTEVIVVLIYFFDIVSFLWLNAIGTLSVIIISKVVSFLTPGNGTANVSQIAEN